MNTSMAEPPLFVRDQIREEEQPLFVNTGVISLPHPFKTVDGVAANRRAHGPQDYCSDPDLSEDAHFLKTYVGERASRENEKTRSEATCIIAFLASLLIGRSACRYRSYV